MLLSDGSRQGLFTSPLGSHLLPGRPEALWVTVCQECPVLCVSLKDTRMKQFDTFAQLSVSQGLSYHLVCVLELVT